MTTFRGVFWWFFGGFLVVFWWFFGGFLEGILTIFPNQLDELFG